MKAQITKRKTRRGDILDYFAARIGQRIASAVLHQKFCTSFRTRVSEINRDDTTPLRIANRTAREKDGSEFSVYWAMPRNGEAIETPCANGEKGDTPPENGAAHSPAAPPLAAPRPSAVAAQGTLFG